MTERVEFGQSELLFDFPGPRELRVGYHVEDLPRLIIWSAMKKRSDRSSVDHSLSLSMEDTVTTTTKLRSLLPILGAGVFMTLGVMVLVFIGRERQSIVRSAMPEMDLVPLIGETPAPSIASLKGKVVVMQFWGTWCSDCSKDFPKFAAMAKTFATDAEVEFVSISCSKDVERDMEGLRKDTEGYLTQKGVTMPVYADPAATTRGRLTGMISRGGFSYPTTLLLDRDGVIDQVYRSPLDASRLEAGIRACLNGKK